MVQRYDGSTTIQIVYDGDGNRVMKAVNGAATYYLVDDRNPSGYAQVLEELIPSGSNLEITRAYNYGHSLISEALWNGTSWELHYYGYDGHGSVRLLMGADGTIQNTYTYDAFGILIGQTGSTPNNYLYSGEQFDFDLGEYYLRARYYNPNTGRFWTMDAYVGNVGDPPSLHKYLYAGDNPVNGVDPRGHETLTELMTTTFIETVLVGFVAPAVVEYGAGKALAGIIPDYVKQGFETVPSPDAVVIGVSGSISGPLGKTPFGVTGVGGFDVLWSPHTTAIAAYGFLGGGVTFGRTALAGSGQVAFGVVFSCADSQKYAGEFLTVSIPYKRLSRKIRDRVDSVIDNATGYIANILSGPVNANGDLVNITKAVSASGVLDKSSVNVFWNRNGGSFGISFGYNVSPKIATSNVSIVGSWYWQLYPPDDRPAVFR